MHSQIKRCPSIFIVKVNLGTIVKQEFDDEQVTMLSCNMNGSIQETLGLFIDVLTSSQKDPHHVKVSLLAGSPDMVESKLAVICLAQIESNLVLS